MLLRWHNWHTRPPCRWLLWHPFAVLSFNLFPWLIDCLLLFFPFLLCPRFSPDLSFLQIRGALATKYPLPLFRGSPCNPDPALHPGGLGPRALIRQIFCLFTGINRASLGPASLSFPVVIRWLVVPLCHMSYRRLHGSRSNEKVAHGSLTVTPTYFPVELN